MSFKENEKVLKEIKSDSKFLYEDAIIIPRGEKLEEVFVNLIEDINKKEFKVDDILILENNNINSIDLFNMTSIDKEKSFLNNYEKNIDNIMKVNLNNKLLCNKSFDKIEKELLLCKENEQGFVFEYNINQKIKVDIKALINKIKDILFIDNDFANRYSDSMLESFENIIEQNEENKILKNLEKHLMFFLFEYYSKTKKINHVIGLKEALKKENNNLYKSLDRIIKNWDNLNNLINIKFKYKKNGNDLNYYFNFNNLFDMFPYGLTDIIKKEYNKNISTNIYESTFTVKTKQNRKPQTDEEKEEELSKSYKLKLEKELEYFNNNEDFVFRNNLIKYILFNIVYLIDFKEEEKLLNMLEDYIEFLKNYNNNFNNKDYINNLKNKIQNVLNLVEESNIYNNYNILAETLLISLSNVFNENNNIEEIYYIDFEKIYKYFEVCNDKIYNKYSVENELELIRDYNFISKEKSHDNIEDFKVIANFKFYKNQYIDKKEVLIEDKEEKDSIKITTPKYPNSVTIKKLYDTDLSYLKFMIENIDKNSFKKNKIEIMKEYEDLKNKPKFQQNNKIEDEKYMFKYNQKYVNIIISENDNYLNLFDKARILVNNKASYDYYNFDYELENIIKLDNLVEAYKKIEQNNLKKILFKLNFSLILTFYFKNLIKNDTNEYSINLISLLSEQGKNSLTDILYFSINDLAFNITSIHKKININKQTINMNSNLTPNEIKNKLNSSRGSLIENAPMNIINMKMPNIYLIASKYDGKTKKYHNIDFLLKDNKLYIGYNSHDFINFNIIKEHVKNNNIDNVFFVINKRDAFSTEINILEKNFYDNIEKGVFIYQTTDSKVYDEKYKNKTYVIKEKLTNIFDENFDYSVSPLYSINSFLKVDKEHKGLNISKGNIYLINNLFSIDEINKKLFYEMIYICHAKFTNKVNHVNDNLIIKNNIMRNLWKTSDSEDVVKINSNEYKFLLTTIANIFTSIKYV